VLVVGAVAALAAQPILAQAPSPAPPPRPPARPAAPPAAPAPPQPAQKPYKMVAVTIATAPREASFDALRKELVDIAKRRDRAARPQLGSARAFFGERDFSGSFEARRPSIDTPAAALAREADDGGGWDALAGFAAETSVGPLPGRPGVVCPPAIPQFDDE